MKNMKKIFLSFILLILQISYSQEVGINTSTPDNSAVLDVFATNKGVLFPRVALVNVVNNTTPVNNPANGLIVYNTNATVIGGLGVGFYVYNGSEWQYIKQGIGTLDFCYDYIGNGLGRTIIADAGAVKIEGTDGLWVTGIHTSGATIDSEFTGAGTRMFYNPQKSAFRAGTVTGIQFNQNRVGNFSGAFGLDNAIYGGRNFGAGYNNITSNVNASSFGTTNNTYDNAAFTINTNNSAGGNNSFASGNLNTTGGYHGFTSGIENSANTINETSIGHFSRNKAKTIDTGSGASFDQLTDSASNFYTTDGLFAIGNGTDNANRHDAISIMKDGYVEVNQEYKLPLTDGTNNQVLITDGNGNLSWRDKIIDQNISHIPLFADDNNFTLSNTSFSNLGNIKCGFNPLDYETSGNVKVRLIIKYQSLTGTYTLRLRDDNGNNLIVGAANFNAVTTATGGVIYTNWINYSGSSTISLHLNGRVTNPGESLVIEDVYVLIKPQ